MTEMYECLFLIFQNDVLEQNIKPVVSYPLMDLAPAVRQELMAQGFILTGRQKQSNIIGSHSKLIWKILLHGS